MAAKAGIGKTQVVDIVEGIFRDWAIKSVNLQNKFSGGQAVSIDAFVNSGYHDARRALETFDAMQTLITDNAWAADVRAEGVTRHGVGYDIVAEIQALRTLLAELQTVIITAVGGVDAEGYITAPYIKLTDTAPFFSTVAAVDYAPVNTKLQEIAASIES